MQNTSSFQQFIEGCATGNLDAIHSFVDEFFECLNLGVEKAFECGHKDVYLPLHLKFDAVDLQRGLNGACRGGQVELVKYLVESDVEYDLFQSLTEAFKGNNEDVIRTLIDIIMKKGQFNTFENTLYHLFLHACECGDISSAQRFVKMGAFDWNMWNMALQSACRGGHKLTVQYALDNKAYDFDWGLFYAALGGFTSTVKSLLVVRHNSDINAYLEIMDLMVSQGAKNMELGLDNACVGGHVECVKFACDKGAKNLKECLELAKQHQHTNVVNYLESLLPKEEVLETTQ
jgi:hypothetical protein